jgi:hypothetical protein
MKTVYKLLFILVAVVLVAVGARLLELDPETTSEVPPPPPPVDVILNEPTFIGFVPDSLQLDSAMNALGEENFYIGMDDHAWFTYQLLEKTLAADVPVIWEYGAALSYLIPGDVDDRRLIKDPSELFQYFYFDGDSLFETNIFLEGTPLENYEVHRDSIQIEPTVESENLELHLSDTAHVDLNGNGVDEMVFLDFEECTSLVIQEEGAEDIRIGCGAEWGHGIPNDIGWVDEWSLEVPGLKWESFLDAEDMLDERQVSIPFWGVYIGKQEASGGILCYIDGELVYLHQGC